MQIREAMTPDVRTVTPGTTLREAAHLMAGIDAGVLPVSEGDRLVGMVTDRDIAVRGVAEGCGPEARVCDIMSREVKYCFDDAEADEVLVNMAEIQVRRMPVVDHDKRLVGIISLADLDREEPARSGHALRHITEPGGNHNQSR